jgi:endonuclease/exonuclease/phosphatase family metal-dependent hydrolase
MLASVESLVHWLRRRFFSRSEWAARHFGLRTYDDSGEEPGLLLIQIDGLARSQLEAAITAGRMPFLESLLLRESYGLRTFYSGLPSTTPAVQAELYYGVRAGVPAFSFVDRSSGEAGTMFDSEWAREFEIRLAAHAEGLLRDGSSWSNIYSGGADAAESHFCIASSRLGAWWSAGRVAPQLLYLALQIPALVRIAALGLLELAIGASGAIGAIFRRQWVALEFGMLLSRMCVGIGVREIIRVGGKVDIARGLPIVHVNFLGYDELAHRRGPGSRFAHWSLRGIDRAIRDLHRAAHWSRRRDYHVWIFSDHGQEPTRPFSDEFPGGLNAVVASCLGAEADGGSQPQWELWWRALSNRWSKRRTSDPKRPPSRYRFTLTAMGSLGHLYLAEPRDETEMRELSRHLVSRGRVPGVLRKASDGTITWYHALGETAVPTGVPELLTSHPEPLRAEIARDLESLCRQENAGDLVLLGWGPEGTSWSFAPERGAHAGPGPEETRGFLLLPNAARLPAEVDHFIRPDALRHAALDLLGRRSMKNAHVAAPAAARLRVMSYNVHGCMGMDGRTSPRRIARVIAGQAPDLVALQELDRGRARSRGEHQASAIAELLGYHVVFCPTIVRGDEHYGHAILSRRPIEIIKSELLPEVPGGVWPEPRAALWTRVRLDTLVVNVVSTHLSLSARERLAQMQALLGIDWLGPILEVEPAVVCGDFNFVPGSAPFRLATSRLQDVAQAGPPRMHTFASARPFVRIDHIFASRHFRTEGVAVVRNGITRVASDHLPLVADLTWEF